MINLVNHFITVDGERLYLKILKDENASEEYCSWLNDPVVNKYLETRETTIDKLKEYIDEKLKSGNCLFFGIFWKENDEHIGNIKLEPIDFESNKATLGILIGNQDYWGKGIGTEATGLLVKYAFDELNLDEVNLGVISENKAAINVYKKNGFEIFRIDEKVINHEGILYDQIWMKKIKQK